MYSHTKIVGPAGRFGARYGKRLRYMISEIESQYKHRKIICPFCNYLSVKRIAFGIWKCEKCGKKFAAKAYKV